MSGSTTIDINPVLGLLRVIVTTPLTGATYWHVAVTLCLAATYTS